MANRNDMNRQLRRHKQREDFRRFQFMRDNPHLFARKRLTPAQRVQRWLGGIRARLGI